VKWLFGQEVDYEGLELPEMLDSIEGPREKMPLARAVPKWLPIPMWRRYKSAVDHFGQIVPELIRAERRADDDRATLLSSFLDAGSGTGNPVTNEEARDEVMSLLFAGYETTAATLIYALYLLDDNPRVADRFYDEVDTVLDGRTPTAADVPDLEYVQAVISETWRLYPPVPRFTSEAMADVDVNGHRIPEGSLVEAPQWLLHRDERFWDDPLAFRPERWFEDSDRPEFAYFPFGGGKRRCVGSSFARMETVLALAAISNTRRFRFDADDLSVSFGFVIVPENSFDAVVERR
jgi:cytochrome P450